MVDYGKLWQITAHFCVFQQFTYFIVLHVSMCFKVFYPVLLVKVSENDREWAEMAKNGR